MYPKLPERLWRNSWLQPRGWRVCQSRQEPWAVCGSSRWGRAVWAQSGSTRFLMMGVVVVVATKEIIWEKYWGPNALARPELTHSLVVVVMVKVEQRKNEHNYKCPKRLNDGIMFNMMGRVSGAFFSFSLVRPPVTGKNLRRLIQTEMYPT